jgi:hypothetical protein
MGHRHRDDSRGAQYVPRLVCALASLSPADMLLTASRDHTLIVWELSREEVSDSSSYAVLV